jgi:hypothetical protein
MNLRISYEAENLLTEEQDKQNWSLCKLVSASQYVKNIFILQIVTWKGTGNNYNDYF